MNTMNAQWEDDDNNRQIDFSVNYRIDDAKVEIVNVTPNQISILCPESKSCVRTLGVHTDKGREMLAGQLSNAGQIEAIKVAIEKENASLINA